MAELQGGQKVRVLLAQALYGSPEALLLDEPTNHLDLDSIHWLQSFLERYQGTLIVISHDRHFLNKVCTHIADIDYQTIITYTGGYDDMVLAKTQIRSTIESDNAQREKKIAQLNDFIARFGAGTRASQVTSRRKEVERLQTTELARSNIQRPYIKFTTKRPSGKVPFECKGLNKAHGTLKVIKHFSAIVNRGEKIVLVGRNGVGKTTMLKALLADAPDRPASPADLDSGSIRWGHEVSIGYFPQDHTGAIEKGLTAVEWLHQFDPDASRQEIHGLLGQMLFSGEEGLKPTEALSGGETARLLFCRIMLLKPNVLILDEPTNHLDLESINALNVALQKFEGTVLLVTHDQDLLEEVGTRVWHFEDGKIVDFKGTLRGTDGHDRLVGVRPIRWRARPWLPKSVSTSTRSPTSSRRRRGAAKSASRLGRAGSTCARASRAARRSAATRRRTSTRPSMPAPAGTRSWRQPNRVSGGSTATRMTRWWSTSSRGANK